MTTYRFTKRSRVAAPAAAVWAHVTTQAGINNELAPVLAMTMPAAFRGRSVADVAPGTRIGRSRLLLFGWLPVGHDDIGIARIVPGTMFREESMMTGMRHWVHQRTLGPDGDGTIVTDEIEFALAAPLSLLPAAGRLAATVLAALFAHRHRRLVRRFARGGQASRRRSATA